MEPVDQWDDIVRKKMMNLSIEQKGSDWKAFEEKLTFSQGEPAQHPDEDFDQVVFHKLNQYEVSSHFKEQHWQLFNQQWNYQAVLRQRLLQFKLLEVMALLVLLLYFSEANAPGIEAMPVPLASHQSGLNTPLTVPAPEPVGQRVTPVAPASPAMPTPPQAGLRSDVSLQRLQAARFTSPLSSQRITEPAIDWPADPIAHWTASPDLPQASSRLTKGAPVLATRLNPLRRQNVHISMLGGADYNQVMTPENLRAGINAFERYAAGYRGGLLLDIGRSNSRLRLGTGLIYTAKHYEVGYQRINGSFLRHGGVTTELLSDIELNILNIPVFARYAIWQGERWSLFAQGGLGFQVALQTNYYAGYPDNFPELSGLGRTPSRYSPLGERNGGLFEGGTLSQNGFFNGQAGLGVERQMAERWQLFFQSRYEYSIGYLSAGLGPTQDRINTFALETGVRVRLK